MTYGIVIPCYNEALRLKLPAFCNFLDNDEHRTFRICFVNDGSTDNTYDILKLIKRQFPGRVEVLNLTRNMGKGEAVRKGVLYYMGDDTPDLIGFMDADLSTNFNDYQNLISRLSQQGASYKMVFGSRPLRKKYQFERSWFRILASITTRSIIRRVVGMPIRDTQCGAKLFTIEMALACFEVKFETRWLFDIELFLRLKKLVGSDQALKEISEVVLTDWKDVKGSKITFIDAIQMPSQLTKIWLHYTMLPAIRAAVAKTALFFRRMAQFKNILL